MENWTLGDWLNIQEIIKRSEYDYSEDFVFWLRSNYQIWDGFLNRAVEAFYLKHTHRFGAKAIMEVMRWESLITEKDKTFKINNNRAPDLARLVMDCRPEMKGYFQIRGSAYRRDASQ